MTGNIWVVLPQACLACGALVVYLTARLGKTRNGLLALLTASSFILALGAFISLFLQTQRDNRPCWGYFGSVGAFLRAEPPALVVAGVALGLGALVAIYSGCYMEHDRRYEAYYPLLLLLVTGLVGMVLAADLFNLYMFCELMSVSAYALVAFRRHLDTAIEAGFKYLVMGSVGTVAMLLGISFIYRETGSLVLAGAAGQPGQWTRAGLACFMVGLGIKSAIVPLHTWLPDAHGRAPSSVSAMLSGIIVQSAFYTLLKVNLGLGLPAHDVGTALIVLSWFNMIVGNGLALVQTNTKRLLAYSTIAQMGYMLLAVGLGLRYDLPPAMQAGFLLLLAHAVMKGLAFLCKGACHFYCNATTIKELHGTASRLPLVAVAFAVALAGLAGVPPLAGFAAKWLLLTGGLQAADALAYFGLTIFLLNSLLALGYYLPVIGALFRAAPSRDWPQIRLSPWIALPLIVFTVMTLAIGFYPQPWLDWTRAAGDSLIAIGDGTWLSRCY